MDPLTQQHYVPILKTKAGDLWSLRYLHDESNSVVRPVLEFTPPSEKKTVAWAVARKVRAIHRALGTQPFFMDFNFLDDGNHIENGMHPVTQFWNAIQDTELSVVPVTGTHRSQEYQQATQASVRRSRELMVRLDMDDMRSADALRARLDAILGLFQLRQGNVHLTLDLGSLVGANYQLLSLATTAAIARIPYIDEWRSLVVSAGSFPASITQAVPERENWVHIPREEWLLWQEVSASEPSRYPTYSDYAVGDPGLPYVGFAYYTVSLRYAHEDDFVVWCGLPARDYDDGNDQIYVVCEDLVDREEYAGAEFSAGDREIHERATTQDSPGNAGSWRQWGTSHYLELVVSQLASLGAS